MTAIIDLRTKDLQEHLEVTTRKMKLKEVRDEGLAWHSVQSHGG